MIAAILRFSLIQRLMVVLVTLGPVYGRLTPCRLMPFRIFLRRRCRLLSRLPVCHPAKLNSALPFR